MTSLLAHSDGTLIAAGNFETIDGVWVNRIARWNPRTGEWSRMGPGVGNTVFALAELPGGDVLIGGVLPALGPPGAAPGMARWRQATQSWDVINDSFATAIAVIPGVGDQWWAAACSSPAPTFQSGVLSRWGPRSLPEAVSATATVPCSPSVGFTLSASASSPCPLTFVWEVEDPSASTGWQTLAGNTLVIGGIYRGSVSQSGTSTLNVYPDSQAFFSSGPLRFRAVVTNVCGSIVTQPVTLVACKADFNCADGITLQDIFDFLNAWFASSPTADFDGINGVDIQDIFAFLNAWFAGC